MVIEIENITIWSHFVQYCARLSWKKISNWWIGETPLAKLNVNSWNQHNFRLQNFVSILMHQGFTELLRFVTNSFSELFVSVTISFSGLFAFVWSHDNLETCSQIERPVVVTVIVLLPGVGITVCLCSDLTRFKLWCQRKDSSRWEQTTIQFDNTSFTLDFLSFHLNNFLWFLRRFQCYKTIEPK